MRISLDQIFYGRGPRGYGVLGISPGGAPFAARVEKLCGAVGTPGSDYGGEPFLLSVPEDDHVLMICGRRGAADSMGRETLSFHALVAAKKDLSAAKADASSLFAQEAFAAKMPTGPIDALPLEVKPGRDGSPSRPNGGRIVDASLPCVIRSDQAAPDAVRAVVGARTIDFSWATFAFQSLDGFDVQVLPPRIAAPRTTNEYDASGNLLRSAAQARTNSPSWTNSDDSPSGRNGSTSRPTNGRVVPGFPPFKTSPMLKLSFAANAALAVLCFALYTNRKPTKQVRVEVPVEKVVEKTIEVPPSQAVTNAIAKAAAEAERKRLSDLFPSTDRILNFDTAKSDLPNSDDIEQYPDSYRSAREFLRKTKAYVDFINTNLPENTKP